jgi:hypothetical protein
MNASLLQSLRPGGLPAVIDLRPDGPESSDPTKRGDDPHHGVSAATVERELKQSGSNCHLPVKTGVTRGPGIHPPVTGLLLLGTCALDRARGGTLPKSWQKRGKPRGETVRWTAS